MLKKENHIFKRNTAFFDDLPVLLWIPIESFHSWPRTTDYQRRPEYACPECVEGPVQAKAKNMRFRQISVLPETPA
jgi:hypothetical protein